VLAVAVAVAMLALWPSDHTTAAPRGAPAVPEHEAKVMAVESVRCPTRQQRHCARAKATFTEGPRRGETASFDASTAGKDASVNVGDQVFLVANDVPEGEPSPGVEAYTLTGFQRHDALVLLTAIFVAFVVIFGRLRGAMALVGLAVSLFIVVKFVVPAILEGRAPVMVAVVGALAVMIVTILLCHGFGPQSIAAILGTSASLGLTAGLAAAFIELANISGVSSEESQLVLAGRADLSLNGLILAGMVIGALGVLDDLTVSQASAVMALRRASPTSGWRSLYRQALTVGRDHVAATVNTLVLAYVGAGLPVLLIISVGGTTLGEAANIEEIAQEIVATLVGSIGLIVAVPITTALTAMLAARLPGSGLPHAAHAH